MWLCNEITSTSLINVSRCVFVMLGNGEFHCYFNVYKKTWHKRYGPQVCLVLTAVWHCTFIKSLLLSAACDVYDCAVSIKCCFMRLWNQDCHRLHCLKQSHQLCFRFKTSVIFKIRLCCDWGSDSMKGFSSQP